MKEPILYLASSSPRRAALLNQLGLEFTQLAPNIDETQLEGETSEAYLVRLATAKATEIFRGLSTGCEAARSWVVASDTAIILEGQTLGKPKDLADAYTMLGRLSSKRHEVWTSIAVKHQDKLWVQLAKASVWFKALLPNEIEAYCLTQEPLGKAGAYAIQGQAAQFIEKIEGNYSTIMGLPLFELVKLLNLSGFHSSQILVSADPSN